MQCANYYDYESNRFRLPAKFPFIKIDKLGYQINQSFPAITLIAPDEVFVWITHSAITPNIVPYRYLISNYGRIWDIVENGEKVINYSSDRCRTKVKRFLDDGYIIDMDVSIHRLVMYFFAYFPNCERYQVRNKNGDKKDNRLCNLEWVVTFPDLTMHYDFMAPKKEPNIDKERVHDICKLLENNVDENIISKVYGIDLNIVKGIRLGKIFTEISSKYKIKAEDKVTVITKRLEDTQIHQVCQLLGDMNYSEEDICNITGCTPRQIRGIIYEGAYYRITRFYDIQRIRILRRGIK